MRVMVCRVVTLLGIFLMPYVANAQDVARRDVGAVVKMNAAYAVAGVVNPQVEIHIKGNSWWQTEVVISPWRSIAGHPLMFGILQNEYRYYVPRTKGLYVGAHAGIAAFNMSKPMLLNGGVRFQERRCKGYGIMAGAVVGYRWLSERHPRLVVDAFVGFGYMHSKYNGYSMAGVIDMYPQRPEDKQPTSPDPFNSSAEWLPTKVGVSVGIALFGDEK